MFYFYFNTKQQYLFKKNQKEQEFKGEDNLYYANNYKLMQQKFQEQVIHNIGLELPI